MRKSWRNVCWVGVYRGAEGELGGKYEEKGRVHVRGEEVGGVKEPKGVGWVDGKGGNVLVREGGGGIEMSGGKGEEGREGVG